MTKTNEWPNSRLKLASRINLELTKKSDSYGKSLSLFGIDPYLELIPTFTSDPKSEPIICLFVIQ